MGVNMPDHGWFNYLSETENIAFSAPGVNSGEAGGFLGATDGLSVTAAYRDTKGNVNAVPPGNTKVSMAMQYPVTNGQRKCSWTPKAGGSTQGMTAPTMLNVSGLAIDLVNHNVTYTPLNVLSDGVSAANNPPVLQFAPVSNTDYPTNFNDRLATGDPGTYLTATFRTLLAAAITPSGVVRYMKRSTVERNNSPVHDPADTGYQFPGLHFPVDGDGQLLEPIYTAANRNQNDNDLEYHDGQTIESILAEATEGHFSPWICLPWNADPTFYAAVGAKCAAFSLATGLPVYVEMSNEVWNSGYTIFHQCYNEAIINGITLEQRYAQKAVAAFNSVITAFASAGVSSLLVTVLAWQNYASPSIWSSMLTFLGSTDAAKIKMLVTAPYFGDNGDGTTMALAGFGTSYNGPLAPFAAAVQADQDDSLNRFAGHFAAARALGKLFGGYEGGFTPVLLDAPTRAAFALSTYAHDLELRFLQRQELDFAAVQTGFFICYYNICYPGSSTGCEWGLIRNGASPIDLAHAPKLKAHQEFTAGVRVLGSVTGVLSDVPSTSAVGTSLGFVKRSVLGSTLSTTGDGGRVAINNATGEVTVAAAMAGTANGARTVTIHEAYSGDAIGYRDTVLPYNVAPLFQDTFPTGAMNGALWSLGGLLYGISAPTTGTSTQTSNHLNCIPASGAENITGYISAARNMTGKLNFIHVANFPSNAVDCVAYFTLGMNAGAYVGWTLQGTGAKGHRFQSATDTTFVPLFTVADPIWLGIGHNISTGTIELYTAPSTASNPPVAGDWVLQGGIPAGSLPPGFDITAAKIGFGAYTWDGDIPGMTPVQFDGFNTGT